MPQEVRKKDSNKNSKKMSGPEYEIREIRSGDAERAADLIARLKKLNGEFDPLFKPSDKVEADSLKILKEKISDNENVILVAQSKHKVIGVAGAKIRDRIYYEPRKEGAIVEFYIMPEFRRGSLGRELFDAIVHALQKKGAQLITAEFPTQNQIAHKFYMKLGFRSLTNVYAKAP